MKKTHEKTYLADFFTCLPVEAFLSWCPTFCPSSSTVASSSLLSLLLRRVLHLLGGFIGVGFTLFACSLLVWCPASCWALVGVVRACVASHDRSQSLGNVGRGLLIIDCLCYFITNDNNQQQSTNLQWPTWSKSTILYYNANLFYTMYFY